MDFEASFGILFNDEIKNTQTKARARQDSTAAYERLRTSKK